MLHGNYKKINHMLKILSFIRKKSNGQFWKTWI